MKHRFEVMNIKCGGCARSIERALRADPRVAAGMKALKAKAKSFVSCAVRRLASE